MGEELMSPVYIGRYEDGKVVFELHEVTDVDITDTPASDDIIRPLSFVQAMMKQPITLRVLLRKKGLRGFYKAIGMPAYLRTEYLFPKKKKRGTARRKRKIERAKKRFVEFVHAKYGDDMIGTQATQVFIDEYAFAGPFEGEED